LLGLQSESARDDPLALWVRAIERIADSASREITILRRELEQAETPAMQRRDNFLAIPIEPLH